MNYSTLSALLDEKVKVVACVFQRNNNESEEDESYLNGYNQTKRRKANLDKFKRYHYKTLLTDLKVGDLVAVECSSGISEQFGVAVVEVVEVDCELDFDSDKTHKWVVNKIDMDRLQEIKFQEDKLISEVRTLERKARKKNILKAMEIDGLEVGKLTLLGSRAEAKAPSYTPNTTDDEDIPF